MLCVYFVHCLVLLLLAFLDSLFWNSRGHGDMVARNHRLGIIAKGYISTSRNASVPNWFMCTWHGTTSVRIGIGTYWLLWPGRWHLFTKNWGGWGGCLLDLAIKVRPLFNLATLGGELSKQAKSNNHHSLLRVPQAPALCPPPCCSAMYQRADAQADRQRLSLQQLGSAQRMCSVF